VPTTEAPAITQLEEVVALEAELQAMRAEYDSLGAEISRLQAVRSDIAFAVTFHDKSREDGEPLVKRYNRVVRQAAADLLAERQLGWCLAGGHFCSEAELSCAKAMFSRRSYDVKDGYEDHHKSVIATACAAHPTGGYQNPDWGHSKQLMARNVHNIGLVRKAISRYLLECGFENRELHRFFAEAGLPTDMYYRDRDGWYFRPIPGQDGSMYGRKVINLG